MENHDTPTDTPARPFAFWLRVADGALAREFQDAVAREGIGRRDARLLALLAEDSPSPEFAERIRRHGGKKLRGLVHRGWVAENDGTWTLTDEGRAVQSRLDDATAAIRARISAAVSDDDLATTRASLEALAREFGAGPGTRMPRGLGRRGFGPRPRPGFGPGGVGPGGFGPEGFGSGGFGPGGYGPEGFGPEGFGSGGAAPASRHAFRPDGAAPASRRGFGPHAHHGAHAGRATEEAYERGFNAGFARGRDASAA